MGGLTSILAGGVLLCLTVWSFFHAGASTSTIAFGVGALFLFVRGFQGQGVTGVEDITAPIDFVTNPAGAMVDNATDQLGDWLADRESSKQDQPEGQDKPGFDPDAIIARYLENRPAAESAAAPAPRGFGRKGV